MHFFSASLCYVTQWLRSVVVYIFDKQVKGLWFDSRRIHKSEKEIWHKTFAKSNMRLWLLWRTLVRGQQAKIALSKLPFSTQNLENHALNQLFNQFPVFEVLFHV